MEVTNKTVLVIGSILLAVAIAGLIVGIVGLYQLNQIPDAEAVYNPDIQPEDFTTSIINPYFALPIGKKMVYKSETDEGLETIEILIPGWTRNVNGVDTLVYWDRVYLDGELIEDTRDYLAQNKKTGDVWYFGEHVDNYENGVLTGHEGAWMWGEDNALPGIWVKHSHVMDDWYRQEYYPGFAEDMAKVDSVVKSVKTPYSTFLNCVRTFEWSPLFLETAYKYYCRQAGGVVLEEDFDSEGKLEQRTMLVDIDMKGAIGIKLPVAYAKEGVVG